MLKKGLDTTIEQLSMRAAQRSERDKNLTPAQKVKKAKADGILSEMQLTTLFLISSSLVFSASSQGTPTLIEREVPLKLAMFAKYNNSPPT